MPAIVVAPPAVAAAAEDVDDDVVVVVAKEIRSAETAVVGPGVCSELLTVAGKDAVLLEFTNVRDREPTDDDAVVATETAANVSESMLVGTSEAAED